MLSKFLNVHKLAPFSRSDHPKPPPFVASQEEDDDGSLALRIVHAGGHVECYYMAIPASTILEKYPSFVLAKREVFRRPWDSVVRPEKILRPGQKFLLVPLRTVKKLRRRIRKPNKESSADHIPINMVTHQNDIGCVSSEASGSFSSAFKKKKNCVKKHVRFAGIDVKHKADNNNVSNSETMGKAQENGSKKGLNSESNERKKRIANAAAWEPSLASISEIQGYSYNN